ncbi:MAG: hypothetical protein VW547_15660 [Alphaproteobacteria bacterium]
MTVDERRSPSGTSQDRDFQRLGVQFVDGTPDAIFAARCEGMEVRGLLGKPK